MKKSRGLLVSAVALAMLLVVSTIAACGSDDEASSSASPGGDVVAVVKSDDQLSQYAQALEAAGLSGEGPYTVFASSDDALSATGVTLDAESVQASVIEGTQLAEADMAKGTKADSVVEGTTIVTYTGADGSLYVNDFKVVGDPMTADNGVVYVIDGVIQPKE
jgi:uncharacterized surface protein with fasciclin (FAS1) repeats